MKKIFEEFWEMNKPELTPLVRVTDVELVIEAVLISKQFFNKCLAFCYVHNLSFVFVHVDNAIHLILYRSDIVCY